MAANSAIEWTDATWNPIVGCSIVSPGCTNCYAMRMAARIENMAPPSKTGPMTHYAGTTKTVNGNRRVWTGKVAQAPDKILYAPLSWRKPKRIFVNSMGDLFHEAIDDWEIAQVFGIMTCAAQHIYQVLTKRAARMQRLLVSEEFWEQVNCYAENNAFEHSDTHARQRDDYRATTDDYSAEFPPPHIWLGVSAERQQEADERIPHLLKTPAAVRFASCEPLLGPLDLYNGDPDPRLGGHRATETYIGNWWPAGAPQGVPSNHGLDWVIVGGESGPHARPMEKAWAESLRDQCEAAEVPFFMKQMARKAPIPPDLLRQEFPR